MASAEQSAVEAAQRIADELGRAGFSYAIGGALALAIAGVPRGTADVDVNVFIPEDRLMGTIEVLAGLGIQIDPEAATSQAKRDGMFAEMMGEDDERTLKWDEIVARFASP